ncbi:MAG: BolA family protein [Paracoccaceae bacterium]|jgi:BolA protein
MELYILTYSERITRNLTEAFAPTHLEVIDESEDHRGHGGYIEGGETHFKVVMKSAAMNGLSRVARQRAVYKVLKTELDERVHALALQIDGDA